MSLIITSNIEDELDADNTSNIFKPFSYQNPLLDTMRIPPNSQIALQSAKINKNEEIVLNEGNKKFGNYFGLPLDATAANIESSTSVPFVGDLGSDLRRGDTTLADGQRKTVTIAETALFIQDALEERTYHPSLITNAVKGTGTDTEPQIPVGANVAVTPKYTGKVWDGFQWVFTQQTAITKKSADFNFVDISEGKTGQFSAVGTNGIAGTGADPGFQVQARNQPISQNDGECQFDFSAANTSGLRSSWFVGLSRVSTEKPTTGRTAPSNYDPGRGGTDGSGLGLSNCGGAMFSDICVMRVGTFLRVFQSGVRSGGGGDTDLIMNEIEYYGQTAGGGNINANFTEVYNLQTNAVGANYEKVKFKLTNEHISIFLIDDKDAEVLLVDNITNASKGAVKNQLTNPTTCAKWAMYPTMGARGAGRTIIIDALQHYTSYPDLALSISEDPAVYDWWIYSEQQNGARWAKTLESRPFNDFTSDVVLTPQLLTAADAMDGYDNQIITAPLKGPGSVNTAQRASVFLNTKACNTSSTFGFKYTPVSSKETGINTLVITILSAQQPSVVSNVSLFVRLGNFTQLSTNARMGTRSKIVGTLPRFDNSGSETGALYFEPNEKTYIDINNPNEITINSFDVDLCFDNERLATSLVGKTVVIFHIRQKPGM